MSGVKRNVKPLSGDLRPGYDGTMASMEKPPNEVREFYEKMPKEALEYFRTIGRKYGAEGGKASAASLTPEQRSERAKKAVAAREAKRKAAREKEKT